MERIHNLDTQMNNFSVIIPTMWIPKSFHSALEKYIESKYIDEIILIDNNPNSNSKLEIESKKITYLPQQENIYVNPAWNLGVSKSKNENILLINDDLTINNIDEILKKILESNFDLIGLDLNNLNTSQGVVIKEYDGAMTRGFGCFIYLKKSKYITIPLDLKIWYGDKILFDNFHNKGVIHFDDVEIFISKTIKSISGSINVINQDTINYKNYKF